MHLAAPLAFDGGLFVRLQPSRDVSTFGVGREESVSVSRRSARDVGCLGGGAQEGVCREGAWCSCDGPMDGSPSISNSIRFIKLLTQTRVSFSIYLSYQLKSSIPPRSERKKLIPLASMFFFILFNYTILRDTKDVLMVTAKKSGAEVIPFIKTYVNLPAAIGFTALYSKLCDRMEQRDGELKFMRNELRRMNISSFLVIFTI
jgi:hypothetical protein